MANWNALTISSTYVNVIDDIVSRDTDIALAFDPAYVTPTNTPTNTLRFNSAASKWQRFNGTTWVDATTTYAISISGNAATASSVAWSAITGKPTTISGYGITDLTAANTAFSATGGLSSTTVQAALAELDSEKAPVASPTFTGTVGFSGPTVNFSGVNGSYTGVFNLGARTFRQVTSGNQIQIVNAANNAITHTFGDNGDFSVGNTLVANGTAHTFGWSGSTVSVGLAASSANRGYIYADGSGVGFLGSPGGWALNIPFGTNSVYVAKNARGPYTVNTANVFTFDLSTSNHFGLDVSTTGTLTFSNLQVGQSGSIVINNTNASAISKAANVYAPATFLATISQAGLHYVSYYSFNGSSVLVSAVGPLS